VVVQSGNVVGFVDFSRTDSLDPQFRRGMIRCLAAIGEEDVDRAFDAFAELVVASEQRRSESFARRLSRGKHALAGQWAAG
jgi:predicted unusual protein kinase regulating ubiquinone biosynthesis (AarF/ABC1/UbiB family)